MTFAHGTRFEPRPSATLTRLLATVVALAAAAPIFTSLPWYLRLTLPVGLAIHGSRGIMRYRQMPLRSVSWSWDDFWLVTDRQGRPRPADLVAARVAGTCVFLHLAWQGGTGRLALFPDNMDTDELRLLRARLGQGQAGA